jgi:GTPase SAR1 family protein
LPRIAVLGSQSAGKSSVLESIVGLDFLPRGSGVVTRRPLELRLNHIDEGITPYGVFPEEIPGRKFTKFAEVRDNIINLTDKLCGNDTNIVDKPIVLQVFSHTCPDLTLIDLPGITKIAIPGQP